MGLLHVFSEEAVKTAGEYAVAQERTNVSNEDMSKALKYQARMFFQQVENFNGRVDEAARELLAGSDEDGGSEESGEEGEEGEEEESEEEEAEGEEEEEAPAAYEEEGEAPAEDEDETLSVSGNSVSGNSVSTSNSRSTVSTVSASSLAASVVAGTLGSEVAQAIDSSAVITEAETARCKAVARRVDAIVASWSMYEPTDPVLLMIKNAIDATDRRSRQELEEQEGEASPRPSKRPRA